MKALVVFHDHGTAVIRRFLKPGFRHVFVVIESGAHWIMFDPRNGIPVQEVVADADFDLAGFYRKTGLLSGRNRSPTQAVRMAVDVRHLCRCGQENARNTNAAGANAMATFPPPDTRKSLEYVSFRLAWRPLQRSLAPHIQVEKGRCYIDP